MENKAQRYKDTKAQRWRQRDRETEIPLKKDRRSGGRQVVEVKGKGTQRVRDSGAQELYSMPQCLPLSLCLYLTVDLRPA
jgi:hypothetical protein